MPFQSEDPDCFWTNQTEQLAHECLIENPGAFFDGCKQTCVNDLFWLHLSQGLELEHFVYGKVILLIDLQIFIWCLAISRPSIFGRCGKCSGCAGLVPKTHGYSNKYSVKIHGFGRSLCGHNPTSMEFVLSHSKVSLLFCMFYSFGFKKLWEWRQSGHLLVLYV